MAAEHQDINTEWQQIKDSVLNAMTEVIQYKNKKPRNEWWDDECRKAMEEKNLARMKGLNRRTRINQNDYIYKKRRRRRKKKEEKKKEKRKEKRKKK